MPSITFSLKERRRLVLVPRETPPNEIHLENMLVLAGMGAVIVPPMPAFYNRPEGLSDIVDHHRAGAGPVRAGQRPDHSLGRSQHRSYR
jgi:polyprenyl P-hydroxybenzoate/phenylacrylic acid decarboxylase-like protein